MQAFIVCTIRLTLSIYCIISLIIITLLQKYLLINYVCVLVLYEVINLRFFGKLTTYIAKSIVPPPFLTANFINFFWIRKSGTADRTIQSFFALKINVVVHFIIKNQNEFYVASKISKLILL
jgi:hypothetical protein